MALKIKAGILAAVILSLGVCGNVFAVEFDGTGLDADGTFHVDMAPPKNMTEQYVLNEMINDLTGGGWGITAMGEWNCNEAFTECKLVYHGDEWTEKYYGITYVYNKEAEALIGDLMDSLEFPDEGFFISDLDYLKFLVQSSIAETEPALPAFSSELKTFLGNRNLELMIDVRLGGYDPLMDFQGGMAKVFYNGTLYGVYDKTVMVYAPHVFYVEDDAEDVVAALEARIAEAFGSDILENISFEKRNETIGELYATDCAAQPNGMCEAPEEYFDSYEYFEENEYLDDEAYDVCILREFDGEMMGVCYTADIVADSSKITKASGINSTDLVTNVNISTAATDLPGDALAYAEALGSDDKEMAENFGEKFYAYDLGLRSASLNEDVSYSEDGFTVSVPVPEILSGVKSISAYWKDSETDEFVEYEGQIKNGKVEFETSHFSTYVFAASSNSVPGAPNTGVNESGLGSVMTSLPIFGVVVVLTGAAAFVVTRKR